MSWAKHHLQSEIYAASAERVLKDNDVSQSLALYRLAAEQETLALDQLDSSKLRTIGITAVSAASLWFKARELTKAQNIAYRALAITSLPAFAVNQLKELLQEAWKEEAFVNSGIEFSEGEVLISVSGGEVVTGGAPMDLILRKVDEIGRILYRTIELLLQQPLRRRGLPSSEIQEQFRPWLFQTSPASYRFAVRVEKPKQLRLPLFPDEAPAIDHIVQTFLDIVRASAFDPEGALTQLVPDEQYRATFLKLTRNLAPSGKSFNRLTILSAGEVEARSIILLPEARQEINQAIRKTVPQPSLEADLKEVLFRGVLRNLHLDKDWLELRTIDESEQPTTIHIQGAGDELDDVIGPMVNHQVIVATVKKSDGRYHLRDIQPAE